MGLGLGVEFGVWWTWRGVIRGNWWRLWRVPDIGPWSHLVLRALLGLWDILWCTHRPRRLLDLTCATLIPNLNQNMHTNSTSYSSMHASQGISSSLSSPKPKLNPPSISPFSLPTASSHFLFLPSPFFFSSSDACSSNPGC